MIPNCLKCTCIPEMFQELMNIYQDGDPIRMMELLITLNEIGTKTGLLSDSDRTEITLFSHVLAMIGQQRVRTYQLTIETLKTPL